MIMLLLFLTGLFAGTVDAIAGGGGLISLPMLLSIGVPPHVAVGTNKLQGTIGTLVAALKYHRHGLISIKTIYRGMLIGLVGAILGAVVSQMVSSNILQKIIPLLLFIILIYTLFSPKLGHYDQSPRLSENLFYLIFGLGLSFYDGFFGPGVGSFWVFTLTFFLGYNLIKATAYTKIFNLNSSFIATICFAVGGNIDYRYGFCMATGALLGGKLGAHLAITKGAQLIRPIFILVVMTTMATLIYRDYSQSPFFMYVAEQYGIIPQLIAGVGLLTSFILLYLKFNKRQDKPT